MNRRQVVKSIGLGLPLSSGCISVAEPGESGQNSANRRVTVKSIDDVPASAGVEFSIKVEKEKITPEATALLTSVMKNMGDTERRIKLPYYKGASSWAGTPGILLYSVTAPDSPSANHSPECLTRPREGKKKGELGWSTESVPTPNLAPGESHTEQIVIVDDWTVSGCFPEGRYRFESPHKIRGEEFRWGFTLQVSEIDE